MIFFNNIKSLVSICPQIEIDNIHEFEDKSKSSSSTMRHLKIVAIFSSIAIIIFAVVLSPILKQNTVDLSASSLPHSDDISLDSNMEEVIYKDELISISAELYKKTGPLVINGLKFVDIFYCFEDDSINTAIFYSNNCGTQLQEYYHTSLDFLHSKYGSPSFEGDNFSCWDIKTPLKKDFTICLDTNTDFNCVCIYICRV